MACRGAGHIVRVGNGLHRTPSATTALRTAPLGPDRVPGGLELHDRLQARQRVAVRARPRHRLTVSDASSSIVTASDASPVASTIALTSRWPHSGVTSSSMRPHRRLSTPPGTSETPATSPRSSGRSGQRRETSTTAVLPAASTGATSRISPRTSGSSGASTATTPVGSGVENDRCGPGDRVDAAHHGRELVGPARVVDEQVDGRAELGAASARHLACATAARRARRSATPAPRRSGRAPARGCRRCASPSRRTRRGRP